MAVPVVDTASPDGPSLARRLLFWVGPPVLVMAGIFFSGTDVASSNQTHNVLIRLLSVLAPSWITSPGTVDAINHWVRKGGHFSAYACLAALTARAAWGLIARLPLRAVLAAWAVAVTWAAVDEFHQSFTPTRGASVYDVLLDAAGALTGVLLYTLWKNHSARRAA